MKIGIEVNGVLRDTIGKFKSTYEKFLIDNNSENLELEIPFDYKINEPIDSLDLMNHFSFQNKEEYFTFLYEEFPMEIFGHSPSAELSTFNDLNDLYIKFRDKFDFIIISDEISKSKPATLFFLSKFGCLFEKIFFYNEVTKDKILSELDLIVTSNPDIIINYTDKVVKYETTYNNKLNSKVTITKLKELESIIGEKL